MEFVDKIKSKDFTLKQSIILTILASLFTAVCAQLHFYLPGNPVPVTLQVFAVVMCGYILGSRLALISQIQYIFAGIVGLPVFAGFKSGLIWIWGPTGGYILAFAVCAYVVGKIVEGKDNSTKWGYIAGILGVSIIYIIGSAWLGIWIAVTDSQKLTYAYVWGVLPFIGFDILKVFIASNLCFERKKS